MDSVADTPPAIGPELAWTAERVAKRLPLQVEWLQTADDDTAVAMLLVIGAEWSEVDDAAEIVDARLPSGWSRLALAAAQHWPQDTLTDIRIEDFRLQVSADPEVLRELLALNPSLLRIRAVQQAVVFGRGQEKETKLLTEVFSAAGPSFLSDPTLPEAWQALGVLHAVELLAGMPLTRRSGEKALAIGDALISLVRREGSLPVEALSPLGELLRRDTQHHYPQHVREAFWQSSFLRSDQIRHVVDSVRHQPDVERLWKAVLQHEATPIDVCAAVVESHGLPSIELQHLLSRRADVRSSPEIRRLLMTSTDALVLRFLMQDAMPQEWMKLFSRLVAHAPLVALGLLDTLELPPHAPLREQLVPQLLQSPLRDIRAATIAALGRWSESGVKPAHRHSDLGR